MEPTDDGKRRYPPDGLYWIDRDWCEPCTCTRHCAKVCRGECGCSACLASFEDSVSDILDET